MQLAVRAIGLVHAVRDVREHARYERCRHRRAAHEPVVPVRVAKAHGVDREAAVRRKIRSALSAAYGDLDVAPGAFSKDPDLASRGAADFLEVERKRSPAAVWKGAGFLVRLAPSTEGVDLEPCTSKR